MRQGFESTSDAAGTLKVGEIVDVLDGRLNDAGVMRIQTDRGWVNTKAGDGTRLLKALRGAASGSEYGTELESE